MGLGGVLDHRHAGELDRCGRPAVEVHGHHRRGALGPRLGRGDGIERRRGGIDVGVHRDRPDRADRGGGRHGRERRHDHLVAGPDAGGGQGQLDRSGAGGDRDRVAGARPRGELGLERLGLRPEQHVSRREDSSDGGLEVGLGGGETAGQVDDRYHSCSW
jgi:hypothetical protein